MTKELTKEQQVKRKRELEMLARYNITPERIKESLERLCE